MAYSLGLLSFMLVKVLAPGFFSRQDTKTPVKFGIWCMVANMVFNLILAIPFGYIGLALATSLSATMNAGLLYYALAKQGVYRVSGATLSFVLRVVLAALGMAVFVTYLPQLEWAQMAELERVFALLTQIFLAAVLFVVALLLLGIRPRHIKHVNAG